MLQKAKVPKTMRVYNSRLWCNNDGEWKLLVYGRDEYKRAWCASLDVDEPPELLPGERFGLPGDEWVEENESPGGDKVSGWRKARKVAIAEFREATPEDEEMIRRLEPEAIEALGLDIHEPLWPHYLIMRGSEGEIYPQARFIFEKNYEVVHEHRERDEMRLGWAE